MLQIGEQICEQHFFNVYYFPDFQLAFSPSIIPYAILFRCNRTISDGSGIEKRWVWYTRTHHKELYNEEQVLTQEVC